MKNIVAFLLCFCLSSAYADDTMTSCVPFHAILENDLENRFTCNSDRSYCLRAFDYFPEKEFSIFVIEVGELRAFNCLATEMIKSKVAECIYTAIDEAFGVGLKTQGAIGDYQKYVMSKYSDWERILKSTSNNNLIVHVKLSESEQLMVTRDSETGEIVHEVLVARSMEGL